MFVWPQVSGQDSKIIGTRGILVSSVGSTVNSNDIRHEDCDAARSCRSWRSWLGFRSSMQRETKMGGWKPVTLRAPILGGFVLISILIIIALEIMFHISKSFNFFNLWVYLSSHLVDHRLYTYLPTIIAVCYSMIWGWVDLDTKRLEPWFQLSQKDGATAENSLLLQYPFDLLPFIPVTAFRRRHWAVFVSGTIMLLVFWVITPLQSSIFNIGIINRSTPIPMGTSATLSPLKSQVDDLNINFLHTAYSISWLGQNLPPFTTYNHAFLPFKPTLNSISEAAGETWSTEAYAMSTDLHCTTADVTYSPTGYTFDNGRGCSVSYIVLAPATFGAKYMVSYIGYYDNAILDWSLQNRNCSSEHANNFLALWASKASVVNNTSQYGDLVALFCRPSYTIQNAHITVNASNGVILSSSVNNSTANVAPIGDSFNTSHFEYLMGVGVQSYDQRANYPDTALLEQFPSIESYGVAWPVPNMVGFALALNPVTVPDLAVPANLHDAFERAHKLLFSAAISTLTVPLNDTKFTDVRTGFRQDTVDAIIMVRTISIVVEATLALIAFMTICLWCFSSQRTSYLTRDPSSISDIMSFMKNDSFSKDFRDDGKLTESGLTKRLLGKKFLIAASDDGDQVATFLDPKDARESFSIDLVPSSLSVHSKCSSFVPVRPIELRMPVALFLVLLIMGSLSGIVLLGISSKSRNGIPLPSTNTVVLSILQNYIPTIISTILEPAWVTLNRVLCVLQPFEELRRGNARSAATIEARYTSLPPQLVVWRALRSKHFFLALVCIVAVSGNILAVALSGLISESPAPILVPIMTSQDLLPKFNGTFIRTYTVPASYYSHLYAAMANIKDNTPLPSWIDKEYFYLPVHISSLPTTSSTGDPLEAQSVRLSTTGFGMDLSCSDLSFDITNANNVVFEPLANDIHIKFFTTHLLANGTRIQCVSDQISNFADTQVYANNFTNGLSALEVINPMQTSVPNEVDGICSSLLVAGWARLGAGNSTQFVGNNSVISREIASTFMSCVPSLKIATFDVVVDQTGLVLSSQRTGDFAPNPSIFFPYSSALPSLIKQANELIMPATTSGFTWHNDSFTSDWMNSLLVYKMKSPELVDPASPLPNTTVIAPLLEGVYKQLFALLLGLNTHVFAPAPEGTSVPATVVGQEMRFFISPAMSYISITILSLQLITAILFYSRRPKRFLPRMPTSIASVIAFVAASHAVEDLRGNGQGNSKHRAEQRYAYGRLVGTDGKTRVGIEKQELVVPLESENPEVKRRKWWTRFREEDEKEVKTWI